MYCVYGNSSWYIHGGPLFGGGPLLGGSVIGGYQEFTDMRNFILRGLAVTARDPAMYGSESAVRIQSGGLQTSCG